MAGTSPAMTSRYSSPDTVVSCEERSDEAVQNCTAALDCFTSLAMTVQRLSRNSTGQVTIAGNTVISTVNPIMMKKNGSTFQAT